MKLTKQEIEKINNGKFPFKKTLLEKIPTPIKRTRYRDENNSGLIIEFHTSGRKTFRVYKRLKGQKSPLNVTIGTFPDPTVENAQIKARSILNQVAVKINPNQKAKVDKQLQITLEEVFSDYMSKKKKQGKLKKPTIRNYNQIINCYLKDWKQIPIKDINESMIVERHEKITSSAIFTAKKASPAQADYAMRFLKAVYNFSKSRYKNSNDIKIFTANPVDILTEEELWNNVPRKTSRIHDSYLKLWFKAVLEVKKSSDNFTVGVCDYLVVAFLSGLRMGELLRLQWTHINFDDKLYVIGITDGFIPAPGKEADTKNGKFNELPISEYLYELLDNRKNLASKDEKYVFNADNDYGHIISPKKIIAKVNDKFKELCKKEDNKDFKRFITSDLRRTFITTAESLGIGLYTVKRLVNHKITRDVTHGYMHHTAKELRESAQKIENELLEGAEIKSTIQLNREEKAKKEEAKAKERFSTIQLLDILENLTSEDQLKIMSILTLKKQHEANNPPS